MNPKKFALIGGIVMLVMGLAAFVPMWSWYSDSHVLIPIQNDTSYGLFLGLFPMNIFNKLTLVIFGILGIAASSSATRGLSMSIQFSRAVFIVMGVASLLGMIESTKTLGGNWPLYGNEVWTHGVFALLGAYYGFALTTRAANELKRRLPETKKREVPSASLRP